MTETISISGQIIGFLAVVLMVIILGMTAIIVEYLKWRTRYKNRRSNQEEMTASVQESR